MYNKVSNRIWLHCIIWATFIECRISVGFCCCGFVSFHFVSFVIYFYKNATIVSSILPQQILYDYHLQVVFRSPYPSLFHNIPDAIHSQLLLLILLLLSHATWFNLLIDWWLIHFTFLYIKMTYNYHRLLRSSYHHFTHSTRVELEAHFDFHQQY